MQEDIVITREKVKMQGQKIPMWKAPGPDEVQGSWLKKFTSLHNRLAVQLDYILNSDTDRVDGLWVNSLVFKGSNKRKISVNNYRPISCLPLMWKLLTGEIGENTYNFLEVNNLMPGEQKECRRNSRTTKDQLLIDKTM